MTARMPTRPGRMRDAAASAAKGVSWVSLVAATTLGLGGVDRVRARISAGPEVAAEGGAIRLIVQAYAKGSLAPDTLPGEHARPLGSTQRAVTAEELVSGVAVDLVQVADSGEESNGAPVVVAWLERGAPNLEFDALRARPSKDAFYGTAQRSEPSVATRVVLSRKV